MSCSGDVYMYMPVSPACGPQVEAATCHDTEKQLYQHQQLRSFECRVDLCACVCRVCMSMCRVCICACVGLWCLVYCLLSIVYCLLSIVCFPWPLVFLLSLVYCLVSMAIGIAYGPLSFLVLHCPHSWVAKSTGLSDKMQPSHNRTATMSI